MSEAQAIQGSKQRTANDLTGFQHNTLIVLAEKPMYGLAIKRKLEEYYEEEINHGRLYPNLDELVAKGLLEKSELDKRTNQYELTKEGYELLLGDLDWTFSKLNTDEERAEDVRALMA